MHDLDDNALLRRYAEQNSEAAFAALVERHDSVLKGRWIRHHSIVPPGRKWFHATQPATT
jgi:hypothetical protein